MAKGKEAPSLNREELFNLAVEAVNQGNKQSARVMFRKILGEDKRNTRAMLWLAKIAPSEKERVMWLNKILDVNPSHEGALAAMNKMKRKGSVERNQLMLRIGVGAYGIGLLLVALLMIVTTAAS
jgi:Tfp pilus assembly protein PilF